MEIEFKELKLGDRAVLERYYFTNRCRSCDNTFANIFCWRDMFSTQWAEVEGFLVVRFIYRNDGRLYYMMPLGAEPQADFTPILPMLAEDAARHGDVLRIAGLTVRGEQLLSGSGRSFAIDTDRSVRDYIYLADDLRHLRGEKFAAKRNHINKFLSRYDFLYEPLGGEHYEECMRLVREWCRRRGGCSEEMEAEFTAMRIAFENFEDLGLVGGVLRVEGRMVAFTYGSAVCDEVFCTHVEKADTGYDGAYAMINQQFALHLPDNFKYINREEDMGIAGLRKAKLSYHPVELSEKACALLLSDDLEQVMKLWRDSFGDDDEFVGRFLVRFHSPQNTFVHHVDGRVVAMLHVVPCSSALGRTAYVYGVATAVGYRRRGISARLMEEAVESCRERGYDAVILIPAGESLVRYYESLGFVNAALPLRFAGDFDFGTGDLSADLAMVRPLTVRGAYVLDGLIGTYETARLSDGVAVVAEENPVLEGISAARNGCGSSPATVVEHTDLTREPLVCMPV